MSTVLYIALALFFLILGGVFLAFLLAALKIGFERWREASHLSGPLKNVFFGEVKADRDGLRDARIAKGKVWDKATKKWRSQGKLSDDYIKYMVR